MRLVAALILIACAAGAAAGDDIDALRILLDEDRRAHLETDAVLLASHLADTLVSVDAGAVEALPRDAVEAFFRGYFAPAVYHAWDDLEPPRIRVSADGAMAWVVRRVGVDREEPRFGGGRQRRRFTSAWTATYEKRDGAWRMTTVTSTFLPGADEADRLLAAARNRLGGADSVRAVDAEAEVYGPGAPFTVTVRSRRSGEVRIDWSTGFEGAVAADTSWTRSAGAGAPLTAELATLLRAHEAHLIALDPESRYSPLVFSGRVPFEGVDALRLSGADPLGGAFAFFLAVEDTLPLGYVVADHVGETGLPVTVLFERWRETGGLRLFQEARFIQGDEIFHYRYTKVDPAADPDPGVFREP